MKSYKQDNIITSMQNGVTRNTISFEKENRPINNMMQTSYYPMEMQYNRIVNTPYPLINYPTNQSLMEVSLQPTQNFENLNSKAKMLPIRKRLQWTDELQNQFDETWVELGEKATANEIYDKLIEKSPNISREQVRSHYQMCKRTKRFPYILNPKESRPRKYRWTQEKMRFPNPYDHPENEEHHIRCTWGENCGCRFLRADETNKHH